MIEIKNLSFGYKKGKLLFNQLDLQLPMGNIYGLLGKNGAGKTTLLKQITGLLFPQQGECLIFGSSVGIRSPKVLEKIFLIPEEFELPAINMSEFAKLHASFYPSFDFDCMNQYLNDFQITENSKLSTLSFGQKKKFLISFGLATKTPFLIMDEPTNGLDIPSKSQFRKIIASSMDENRSIIISTHQVRDLSSLIDTVIILENGRIIFNQNTAVISEKISFLHTNELDNKQILYSEDIFAGKAVICKNEGNETEIDLELLFNGIITDAEKINFIFKN